MCRWVSKLVLKLAAPARAYNIVGPKYGLPKFKNFIDLIEGDHTLLADIPEWVGFAEVRPSLHYIGPLPARIDRPIPEEVASMPRDKPIIYFAMGSSGKPALVAHILEMFWMIGLALLGMLRMGISAQALLNATGEASEAD